MGALHRAYDQHGDTTTSAEHIGKYDTMLEIVKKRKLMVRVKGTRKHHPAE